MAKRVFGVMGKIRLIGKKESAYQNFLVTTFKKFSIAEIFLLHLQQFKCMVPLIM